METAGIGVIRTMEKTMETSKVSQGQLHTGMWFAGQVQLETGNLPKHSLRLNPKP